MNDIVLIGDAIGDYNAAMNNNNHFIARIYPENKEIFNNIDCIKINNLRKLYSIIIYLKCITKWSECQVFIQTLLAIIICNINYL